MICPSPSSKQREFCYNPMISKTSFNIIGVAGSGKTVSLVNRVKFLLKNSNSNTKILVITFNKVLLLYLGCLLRTTPNYKESVKIVNFDKFLFDMFRIFRVDENKDFEVCNRSKTEKEIIKLCKKLTLSNEESEVILKEIQKIQIDTKYEVSKNSIKVFNQYQSEKINHKLYDFYDLYHWVDRNIETIIKSNKIDLYDHVFIDEGQDLTPESITTLRKLLKPNGTFNLLADYAQEIYDVNPKDKTTLEFDNSIEFRENYRNNRQIADFLKSITEHKYYIRKETIIDPIVPIANGVNPTYVHFDSLGLEYELCRKKEMKYAYEQAVINKDQLRYAILVRTWDELKELKTAFVEFDIEKKVKSIPYIEVVGDLGSNLKSSNKIEKFDFQNGIYIGTYHSAKGLEFEVVHLPFMGISDMPDSVTKLESFPNYYDKQLKLLYVGCSRAIKKLVISYIDEISPLLPNYNDLKITKIERKCN